MLIRRLNTNVLVQVAVIALWLAVAQIVVWLLKLSAPHITYLYTPLEVLQSAPSCIRGGVFQALFSTAVRTLSGFGLAAIIGIVTGVAMGRMSWLNCLLRPAVDLMRPLPSSALIPILVMVIGPDKEATYQFAIVFGGVWPILLSALEGTSLVHKTSGGVMRQLSLTTMENMRWFVLPEAAHEIMTGMRISVSVCLILAVTAEIIVGHQTGLGAYIKDAAGAGNLKESYLATFLIAILGLLLNGAFRLLEIRLPWLVNRDEVPVENV